MSKITRKFNKWIWAKLIDSNGYHKLRIYNTPFGIYWILRWSYWTAGYSQFFSMGRFYIRLRKRFKI